MSETRGAKTRRGLVLDRKRNRLESTSSDISENYIVPRKRTRIRTNSSNSESKEDDAPTGGQSDRYKLQKKENDSRHFNNNSLSVNELINTLSVKNRTFISSQQMMNALPEFDPENKGQNIEIWLHKVNEYAAIYNWEDRQISHFATQKLIGTARNWLYPLPSLDFTWNEWQLKLRRAFPVDDNFAVLLEEMFARKTKPDESLRIYFYDKLMLLNRCEITGKKAVDCLIHGITDPSLRSSAQAVKCQEPEDLLKYLIIQENIVQS